MSDSSGVTILFFKNMAVIQKHKLSHPVVFPEANDEGGTERTRRIHTSTRETSLVQKQTSDGIEVHLLNYCTLVQFYSSVQFHFLRVSFFLLL